MANVGVVDVAIPDPRVYMKYNQTNYEMTYKECQSPSPFELSLVNRQLTVTCPMNKPPMSATVVTAFDKGPVTYGKYLLFSKFNSSAENGMEIDSQFACVTAQCPKFKAVGEKCVVQNIPKKSLQERQPPKNFLPNLLVILVDAFSRAQFEANMPKTVQYLKALDDRSDMHMLNFTNFHVIGPNR